MLPPRAPRESRPSDPVATACLMLSTDARSVERGPTPSPLNQSAPTAPPPPTAPSTLKAQESREMLQDSANTAAPRSPNVSRTGNSYPGNLDVISQGIDALLAEEQSELSRTKEAAAACRRDLLEDPATESVSSETDHRTDVRVDHAVNSGRVARPHSASHSELHKRLTTQLSEVIWFPKGTSENVREDRLIDAFDALCGIDPQDEIEGMLACQIIVTHRAALDCLQLSMAPATTSDERMKIISQVEQLLLSFTRNLAALDQYRSVGRTKAASRTREDEQIERQARRV